MIKNFVKRYRFFLILLVINISLLFISPEIGKKSFSITYDNLLEMLGVIPPIFILLGVLDVWLKKETMIKYMGKGFGVVGVYNWSYCCWTTLCSLSSGRCTFKKGNKYI
ncbi:hypothetical protein I6E36_05150 [Fusobacterium mortiferum]|uniref:hypothetical protein n=1 Tax=Fusobacterium mortiferum TaxID=850 RepID=UPI001F243052|nr:hypothetical protein [Fusobacterium mortiferum]MCF2627466.1 hypothetical protein [Fusobacterium mortiferum]